MKAAKKPRKHDDANANTNDAKTTIIAWDGTPPPPDEPPKA